MSCCHAHPSHELFAFFLEGKTCVVREAEAWLIIRLMNKIIAHKNYFDAAKIGRL